MSRHMVLKEMIWLSKKRLLFPVCGIVLLFVFFLHKLFREKEKVLRMLNDEDVPGIPGYEEIISMSREQLEQVYIKYLHTIQLDCKKRVRYGNKGDGGWFICEDDPYKPPMNSLVYSFGINHDFSFDDAISTGNFKARVHSFDPSDGVRDHKRSERVTFHATGIAGSDRKSPYGWKMETLDSIQKHLGHKQGEVSVLKIDIEGNEFDVVEQILSTGSLQGTKQLMLEWHIPKESHQSCLQVHQKLFFIRALNILIQLYKLGFRLYWEDDNDNCSAETQMVLCHEAYYVQTA